MLKLTKSLFYRPADSPVGVSVVENHPPYPLHDHEFSEIVIILNGTGAHFDRESEFLIKKGDAYFIPRGQSHGFKHTHCLHLINIRHDFDLLGFKAQDLRELGGYHAFFHLEPAFRSKHSSVSMLHLEDQSLERITSLCLDIKREIDSHKTGYKYITTGLFMQVVGMLARSYRSSSSHASQELHRIAEAVALLEKNVHRKISVKDLAKTANMSSRNFERAFTSAMGVPPHKYQVRARVAKACELLAHSDKSVSEVADGLGFEDSNYFSRIFRKFMGMSPSTFKKQNP